MAEATSSSAPRINTITFDAYNGLMKLTLCARRITKEVQLTPQVAAALTGKEQGSSESLYRLADELENSLKSATADQTAFQPEEKGA